MPFAINFSCALKGTVRPDWIYMRLVPLNRPAWKGHQQRYRFFYFNFWPWIFDKSSKFWAASRKNESNLLLVWITVCQTLLPKCRRDINCSLDYGSWVKNSNIPHSKSKYSSILADVREPIGTKDSARTVIRTNRRLDSFLHEWAQNFEVF